MVTTMKKRDTTTKERLAIVETLLGEIKTSFTNHLAHHWWFTMVLLSAVCAEAIGFLALVVKHVFISP
jgi:hypothetical protein